jgi:hypothetical protein
MVTVQKGEQSLEEAVNEYDKGVVARGQEVATSKAQTMAFHDYTNFENSALFKMGIKPAGS